MSSQKLVRGAFLCTGVVLFVNSALSIALASSLSYGDVAGNTVVFGGVTEASLTNTLPLYGTPSASNDSLMFNLSGVGAFNIKASNGGFDFVDGQLTTAINAKTGYGITDIVIQESGDYSLFGSGSTATNASVALAVASVKITAVEGVSITPITITLPASTLKYNLVNNSALGQTWANSLDIDIAQYVAAAGYTGKATLVTLTFDNALYAESEASSGAYIAKKAAEIDVATSPAPEPGTVAMLGIAAVGLAFGVWRKRHAAAANAV